MTPADFKTIRESLGLSAQWLADAVHVDQRTVRRWEDGVIPLRADVVELLIELDARMEADVARELDRVLSSLGADGGAESARRVESSAPQDWPQVEVPRVDADIRDQPTGEHLLPAAFYRAAAGRLRWALGGRLRIVYACA
ncbi:helix-turn-helix domain-containing protein [Mycobacterium sp. 134]|uniref:helix-turn-helix domain-containing protein n=1 Tax=Mycobacterium sp. 134 TaxID=3400425 RepID=UPI003AAE1A4D